MAECARDIKKVSLELGGNATFIVFDDADLDAAVEGKSRNSLLARIILPSRSNSMTACVCSIAFSWGETSTQPCNDFRGLVFRVRLRIPQITKLHSKVLTEAPGP